YSPIGATGVFSVAPPEETDSRPYTLPVEKATIRPFLKRSAVTPGRNVFIAQVRYSEPLVPNFRAAMKITFGISGTLAKAPGLNRSHAIVSTPHFSRSQRMDSSENLDTATTRLLRPASRMARRTSFAKLGPIFPPAPRIRMSPSRADTAWT